MISNYNRKIEYSIYWLGNDDHIDLSRIERLAENKIYVSVFTDRKALQQVCEKQEPDLLIIANCADGKENIDIGLTIKSHCSNNSTTLLVITELLDKETKEYYYQSGGDELILEPASLLEIFFKIKQLKFIFDKTNNAAIQIDEASQMALLAMENSSDLGATIGFVKSATRCDSYLSLAQAILDTVKVYSDSAIVEMVGAEQMYYFGSQDQIDPDLKQVMLSNKNENRIIRFDNAFQINHDNLVLLAEGLPVDDVGRMGRIADNLAILVDTADRFVSELLLKEQAVASEHAKRRFISTISHELNTPMNAIQGFSKLIANKGEDEVLGKKGITALNSICTNSTKMKSIIDTLIEITSGDEGKDPLCKDDIEVSSLVFHIKNSCALLAENKNIKLVLPEKTNIQLKGDQKHINKMLFHLVENAIKFTEHGEVELIVGRKADPKIREAIQFCVRDTGIGISEKNMEQLFKQMGQLDTRHDRHQYGAGLGLYYVQSFVTQLNGKVEVNSVVGEGSEFTLTLPTHIKPELENTELF